MRDKDKIKQTLPLQDQIKINQILNYSGLARSI